jgi:hypothetical protein
VGDPGGPLRRLIARAGVDLIAIMQPDALE